jgi:hypothetical protein
MLQQEHPKATYEAAIARHNTVDTLLSQMSRHWLPGADGESRMHRAAWGTTSAVTP